MVLLLLEKGRKMDGIRKKQNSRGMEGKEGLPQCTALNRMQLTGRKFGPKPTDLQSIMRAWEGLEVLFLVSQLT
jgi:hypothetical protein